MQTHNKPGLFFIIIFTMMVAGLLWSRALLSVSHGLLVVLVLFYYKSKVYPLHAWVLYWSFSPMLLFLLGWFQDIKAPGSYDYLLTLSVYPVAALSGFFLQSKNVDRAVKIMLALGLASLLYPAGYFLLHSTDVGIAYGKGQSLPTFMEGDHVRYGIFLNALLLLASATGNIKKKWRYAIIFLLIIAIVLMAVRTAWVGMLIIIIVCAFSRRIPTYRLHRWIVAMIIPAFVLAYVFIPTVKQKINYTVYDYSQYDANTRSVYSDGTRRNVNYVAWQAITKKGKTGSGWGLVSDVMKENYQKHFDGEVPGFTWPFNQWLYWWLGGGVVALVLFSAWLIFPVWRAAREKNFALLAWTLVITASCLVESTLSLQFGVVLHAWIIVLISNTNKKNLVNEKIERE